MSTKDSKTAQPCTLQSVTCRYSDLVWRNRNECAYNERGRYPDNVMIHHKHKENIYKEVQDTCTITTDRGKLKFEYLYIE